MNGNIRPLRTLLGRCFRFLVRTGIRGEPSKHFRCNLCGGDCRVPNAELLRETVTCCGCGSTVRIRALVEALLTEVLEAPGAVLARHPSNSALVGYGLSDSPCYARLLSRKFRYTNTFYHREPLLDVSGPVPGRYPPADFIIASEVLEHVAPPIGGAFMNLLALLKPGGHLIVTVPIVNDDLAREHYPRLGRFRVEQRDGRPHLVNETREGEIEVFPDPVFHEGPGEALEMRRFSLAWLTRELGRAGFTAIRVLDRDVPERGIVWRGDRSVPVVAERPA